jgi:hypothetical protein
MEDMLIPSTLVLDDQRPPIDVDDVVIVPKVVYDLYTFARRSTGFVTVNLSAEQATIREIQHTFVNLTYEAVVEDVYHSNNDCENHARVH